MDIPEQFYQQLVTFLLLINEKITRQMEYIHKDRLTTQQFLVVATIANYGSMTMTALSQKIHIQKQQATKIVNQLVSSEYLCRVPDPKDRRLVRVDLTELARQFMYEYFLTSTKNAEQRFSALDQSEFEELRSAIEVMNRILPHISVGFAEQSANPNRNAIPSEKSRKQS